MLDKAALIEDLGALLAVKGNGTVDTGEAMLARLAEEGWLPRHVYDWGQRKPATSTFPVKMWSGRCWDGDLKHHLTTCVKASSISSCPPQPELHCRTFPNTPPGAAESAAGRDLCSRKGSMKQEGIYEAIK